MAHSPLPESRFVWVDVFAAWVTTEWLKISKGEELIRKGRFGDAFVPQSFARATPHVEEESAKIKHERENDASVGDAESRSIEVAQNLSLRQLDKALVEHPDPFGPAQKLPKCLRGTAVDRRRPGPCHPWKICSIIRFSGGAHGVLAR